MIAVVVNCLAVILGSTIGMILKKGLPERLGNTVFNGLALCVLYIGISGALSGENVLITILSIALGAIIGEWIDIDGKINRLGNWLEQKFKRGGDIPVAQGFVTASLLFCVGAMSVVGSLQSGLSGNHETIFAKSLIDGIAAIVLASNLGFGVLLASGFILLYQGGITLFAQFLQPFLTTSVVNEMTCVGSLLIIAIAFNMLKITDIKVMNYIPAIFIPIVLCMFM